MNFRLSADFGRAEIDFWAGFGADWRGVYALQALQLNRTTSPIHVAALTALEPGGYAHFLKLSGKGTVWLFAEPNAPTIFRNQPKNLDQLLKRRKLCRI